MFGAVIGDIIGGGFALEPVRTYKLDLTDGKFAFTCNSVLMAAVCDMLYYCSDPPSGKIDYAIRSRESVDMLKKYARLFSDLMPPTHTEWTKQRKRAHCIAQADFSPIFAVGCAYAADTLDDVLALTDLFCAYICDTEHSRSCAKAVNSALYALKRGAEKDSIADYVVGLDITGDQQEIDETLSMKRTPEAAVRAAFEAFTRSYDFDSALRFAIAYGAMSPTVAAVTGALAGEYYKAIPDELETPCKKALGAALKIPLERFGEKFIGR